MGRRRRTPLPALPSFCEKASSPDQIGAAPSCQWLGSVPVPKIAGSAALGDLTGFHRLDMAVNEHKIGEFIVAIFGVIARAIGAEGWNDPVSLV